MDDITFRISVLGSIAVGKTSLITRFADGTFTHSTEPTMHNISVIRLKVEADTVKLLISDNCGVEEFRQMARSYNRHADCLILVYDVTRRHTFESLDKWFEAFKEICEENVPIIIVGNKMDLPYREREVSNQELINYMQGKKAICMETSAKDDYNISKVFTEAVKLILKSQCLLVPGCEEDLYIRHINSEINIVPEPVREMKKVIVRKPTDNNKIVLNTVQTKPKESRGCC